MEGDHRVWPPHSGPRHRRTPPEDTEPAWGARRDEEQEPPRDPERSEGRDRPPEPPPAWGRRGRPYAGEPGWGQPAQIPRRPHPLDLEPEEPGWNPRIQRTAPRDPGPAGGQDDALPPSARLHGTPRDPGARGGRLRRRAGPVLAALVAGAGLVAATVAVALWLTAPPGDTGRLRDALAGVAATLPEGWSTGAVPPVTGFTSVVRDGHGGLVMARPVPGPVKDAEQATEEAAELYSRLLLRGDRVTVVEDRRLPDGHTRALRAEYQDVVNRPAYLRVMLLTRGSRPVLLVGLLQPEENSRRQALDAVMTSLR
ncbi:hypothetical protein [Nonomuraea rubra]|uniref:hypothetical protein n=1 Tax=Nonomuraea rubra TaxID=46180 RepID=UPI0033E07CEF